jgi:D-proline reductase (dithiol) PrdB
VTCHQTVGLLARELEAVGISTILLAVSPEAVEKTAPPRTLLLRFPLGHVLGEPGNRIQHLTVLQDALAVLASACQPGTVVASPYRWRREDYRAIRAWKGYVPAEALLGNLDNDPQSTGSARI